MPGALERVREYAKIGFVLGGGLAALASVRFLINGPAAFRDRIHLSYPAVVALYLAGGVVTCVLLALLEGRAKSLVSYILVGVMVASPGSWLLALALAKPEHSAAAVVFVAVAMALIYGTIGGLLAWRD